MHPPEKFTTAYSGDLRYLFRQIDELGELWNVQVELVMWWLTSRVPTCCTGVGAGAQNRM